MSRRTFVSLFLSFILLACQATLPQTPSKPFLQERDTAIEVAPAKPTARFEESGCEVRLHPEEALYVGDQISFEVIAPTPEPYLNQPITITLTNPVTVIGSTTFQPYGFDRRPQATFLWSWDTSSFVPGDYTLHFSIPTLKEEWQQTITLLPRTALPPIEQTAQWQTLTTACCEIHFITNTAAHRDLEEIAEVVEQEFERVQEKIPLSPEEPVSVVLIPRVIGNGGFANAEINVSYLDRNYTANDFATILRHEMVHVFDQIAQAGDRPSLFVEGIAVYLSGGHYFPEPLLPRAAELIRQKKYLSLRELAANFYDAQHELAYLEAGALIEYLSQRYGWQTVWETYLAMTLRSGETQPQAIERALKAKLGVSFQQLEEDFQATLQSIESNLKFSSDIKTIESYYETLRNYQKQLDPAAYYRTAWMLDAQQMRQRGIVADYFRHPSQFDNLVLELLLNEAGHARRAQEYNRYWRIHEAISAILDDLPLKNTTPFFGNSLADDAWQVVQVLVANGYEPQMWTSSQDHFLVWVTQGTPYLKPVNLEKQAGKWQILSGASAATDDLIQGTQ